MSASLARRLVGLAAAVAASSALLQAQTSRSPVADAAMAKDPTSVRQLLKSGADANAAQGDGMTALHWAALNGDGPLAEMLLVAGANPRATTRIGGFTPLHLATQNGRAAVIAPLVKGGAAVNARTATGTTPLMLAAASGNADVVRLLADCGRGARPGGGGPRTVGADVRRVARPHRRRQGAAREGRQRRVDLGGGRPVRRDRAGGCASRNRSARSRSRTEGAATSTPAAAPGGRCDRDRRSDAAIQVQRAHRQARRADRAAFRGPPGRDRRGEDADRRRRRRQPDVGRRSHQPDGDRRGERPLRPGAVSAREGRRRQPRHRRRDDAALRGAQRRVGAEVVLPAAACLPAAEGHLPRGDDHAARQGRRSERQARPHDLVHAVQLRPAARRGRRRHPVLARRLCQRHRGDEAAGRARRRCVDPDDAAGGERSLPPGRRARRRREPRSLRAADGADGRSRHPAAAGSGRAPATAKASPATPIASPPPGCWRP